MTSSGGNELAEAGPSDDLKGLSVLLVEDSWLLGQAMQDVLELNGADVAGPAATTAEAERLLSQCAPDIAIVDLNLREGERANGLIDRLHAQGVPVVVISGYATLPVPPEKVVTMLQKPVTDANLLAALRPLAAGKMAR